jgi:site-specific DNA-methyltransferase (adenine-specific)
MNTSTLFSSQSDEWSTPQDLFDALHAEFNFSLDPCAVECNCKLSFFFSPELDGLFQPWTRERVFMNPPYSNIRAWMAKANAESKKGATVVCLVPARTDTRWFHESAVGHEIRFIKGRLKFGGAKASAPFPSCIVVMRPPSKIENAWVTR